MTHLSAAVRFLLDWRTRYSFAWVAAVAIAIGRIINGHLCFQETLEVDHPERRIDGNHGHRTIDFGGQWMMGRMLARGYGRELYSRPRQWEVAEQAYPRNRESPTATDHDPNELVRYFMGSDDPRFGELAGAIAVLIGPSDPFTQAAAALNLRDEWPPDTIRELTHPNGSPGVGGPLYPPIHAFLMLPFALGDHPQWAYFAMQYVQVFLCFVAGLGASRLGNGRFWWPVATIVILLFPGCRGVVDLGQNSALSLTLLIWGWVLQARGRPILGGILWGGLAYKPVWAASFFVLLLLMRHWRAALAMALTGLALIALTLPIVGVRAWEQWLMVGQQAARIYNLDSRWIPLSRDVLGLPRRLMLDFTLPRSERDSVAAMAACWALWMLVIEITLRVYALRGRQPIPFTGPLPAFFILATWMCTYHFMYYDALIAAFAVCVLLADSRPFFRARAINRDPPEVSVLRPPPGPRGRRSLLLVNSFALTIIGLLFLHENGTMLLKIEVTAVAKGASFQRTRGDDSTETAPNIIIGTDTVFPVDTLLLMALWGWCGFTVLAGKWPNPEMHHSANTS